ncbi:MAG: hypothetical protein BWY42_00632 [Candidatus Omnitrophica bacterium ADurb.Bin277]|nr:MAG: hypothetical protein BWY42_00632 [Candidatus Omnitrophica bacterium ADurb.Bin277]
MKAETIEVKPMKSKDIALAGYDQASETLEVVFRAGGVYRFQKVPEYVYQELMSASSHGTYFQHYIKNTYSYVKVR